jgi:hypothetical protein
MPISKADGNKLADASEDEPPIVHPSDAEISAALHEVVDMAHSQHQQEGRKVNLT